MILAIDTSNQWIGISLYDGSVVLAESLWLSHNYHTVELAPAVEQMLKRCGVLPRQLQALAVALGPGSYTALRIGLAFAKGISLVNHIPIIGVPTLDILAGFMPAEGLPLLTVLQAGHGRLAYAWYQYQEGRWQGEANNQSLTLEEISPTILEPTRVCGELTAIQRQYLALNNPNVRLATPAQSARHPSFLAEIAWQRWQGNEVDETIPLSPIYLRYGDNPI
jgi:tRNA threonylcarbamoyladenosine biosynthesis protein TsaB